MKYVYHVSPVGGLTKLVPHVSSHGVPYVYATDNLTLALFWGSSKSHGDFDGSYGTVTLGDKRVPRFMETYKDSFKNKYEGEICYIYKLPADTFKQKTGFKGEVVSEVPVKVLSCIKVDDLYARLKQEVKNGNIVFYEYDEKDKAYLKFSNNYILYKILLSNVIGKPASNSYKFVKETYPKILNKAMKFSKKNGSKAIEIARSAFHKSFFNVTKNLLKNEK